MMGSKRRVRRGRQKETAEPDFIRDLNAQVQAALGVMTSEDADGLIGEKPDVLGVLLAGVQASVGLLWSTALAAGARKKPKTLRMVSASQVVLLTLVLYAFAAGVRMGRTGDGPERIADDSPRGDTAVPASGEDCHQDAEVSGGADA